MTHYLSCPVLWAEVHKVWHPRIPMESFLDRRLALSRAMTVEERTLAIQRLVIAFYMYNAVKNAPAREFVDLSQFARAARAQYVQQLDVPSE